MDVHEIILSGEAEQDCPTFVLTGNELLPALTWVSTDVCLIRDPAIGMYRVERLYNSKGTYDKPRFNLDRYILGIDQIWMEQYLPEMATVSMSRREPNDIRDAMKILWEAGLKNVFIMLHAGSPTNYVFQSDTDAIIAMALLSEEGFA